MRAIIAPMALLLACGASHGPPAPIEGASAKDPPDATPPEVDDCFADDAFYTYVDQRGRTITVIDTMTDQPDYQGCLNERRPADECAAENDGYRADGALRACAKGDTCGARRDYAKLVTQAARERVRAGCPEGLF